MVIVIRFEENAQANNYYRLSFRQGRRQRGGSGSQPPHFTFGPPVAAYIQYCI